MSLESNPIAGGRQVQDGATQFSDAGIVCAVRLRVTLKLMSIPRKRTRQNLFLTLDCLHLAIEDEEGLDVVWNPLSRLASLILG